MDATRNSEAVARFKLTVHTMNMYLSCWTNLKTWLKFYCFSYTIQWVLPLIVCIKFIIPYAWSLNITNTEAEAYHYWKVAGICVYFYMCFLDRKSLITVKPSNAQ